MLNKLHNLVVAHKKQIQQVHIQTIQKIVQKIRKLKQLIEKKPHIANLNVKLRKSTQIMDELKKLKRIELMKRVLLQKENPTIVITKGTATAEEIAIAMLRIHKVMQELINQFKVTLEINNDNNEWLLRVSKRRQKITRTEQKRRKRKEVKERKFLLQGKTSEDVAITSEKKNKKTKLKDANETSLKSVNILETEETKGKIAKKQKTESEDNVNIQVKDKKQKSKKEKIKNIEIKPIKSVSTLPKVFDSCKTENPFQQQLNDDDDTRNLNVNFSDSQTMELEAEKEEEATFVVDPFFITDTGENYMSTAVIAHAEQQDTIEETQTNPFKVKKPKNLKDNFKANNSRKHSIKVDAAPYKVKENFYNEDSNTTTKKTAINITKSTSNPEKSIQLHPSWIAKQKLKSTIKTFQGKKITFDD